MEDFRIDNVERISAADAEKISLNRLNASLDLYDRLDYDAPTITSLSHNICGQITITATDTKVEKYDSSNFNGVGVGNNNSGTGVSEPGSFGIVGYKITADTNEPVSDWIPVEKTSNLNVTSESVGKDGIYYVWVIDVGGNVNYDRIEVKCQHSYVKNVTDKYLVSAATCTEPAKYYYSCEYCGKASLDIFSYGSKTKHTGTKVVNNDYLASKATCTSPAKYYYKCSKCNAKLTTTYSYGSKAKHTPVKVTTKKYLASKATCTSPAKYYYKCSTCNATLTSTYSYGSKAKHTSVPVKDTTKDYLASKATCTEPAKYYYKCSVCNGKLTSTYEYGSKAKHTPVIVTTKKYLASAATCASPAKYYYKCNVCNAKLTSTYEYGPKADHTPVKDTSSTYLASRATCTKPAKYYYKCNKCNTKLTSTYSYGKALGHNFQNAVCTRCGIKDEYSFTFDNSLSAWVYVPHLVDVGSYSQMPVIIYLHGGTGQWSKEELVNPANGGLPCYLKDGTVKVGALVVIPTRYNANMNSLVANLKQKYSINEKKISITGYSTGAYWAVRNALKSTNKYSTNTSVKFAACVPVSFVNSNVSNPAVDSSCAARFIYESSPYSWAASIKEATKANVSLAARTRSDVSYYIMRGTNHDKVQSYYSSVDPELGMNILTWMANQSL